MSRTSKQILLSIVKPTRPPKRYSAYDPYIMDHYHTANGRVFTGEFLQDPSARQLVGDEYDSLMEEYRGRRSK